MGLTRSNTHSIPLPHDLTSIRLIAIVSMPKRRIDRRPRDEKGKVIPVKSPDLNPNYHQAMSELVLLRAEVETLRPLKKEIASLRAAIADYVLGSQI